MPIVVRPEHRKRQFLVGACGEEPGTEPGKRWEVHRSEHATGIHVLDPLVDVEAPGPHLIERSRLDAVLLLGPARDGVQADVGDLGPVEQPDVATVGQPLDMWTLVPPLGRQSPVEHGRRLDQMVIHADHDQVIGMHGNSFQLAG
jgi:hypothetical protein